ncbi:NAD(P)H-dependent flavin oxidoreductase [Paenibacillus sp. WLX1005]|uniref:NAD(P)H-dependent flavin oxidoreductase n=1 Tax=Paenibacillus sp. WLX1005 TaxID=3243766 RepID=UPI0039844B85
MTNENRITSILGIQYPIVQAAMSWITDAAMVAAVSNAGGMGVLGPNAGAKFDGEQRISSEERLRREIRKIKTITDKPFAMNVLFPEEGDETSEQYALHTLNVALEEGVRHFLAVGTVNTKLFKKVKHHQAILIFRELTPTPKGAQAAEVAGADILIATGYDEGGWIPQNQIGTFSIIPTIADAVDIPVMATGGINDIRGVRAAFALGAEGVYIGTRFIVSKECPAADIVKQDIVSSTANNLVFVSPLQRSIAHKLSLELASMHENGTAPAEEMSLKPGMLEGKLDEGIISVNTAIDVIKEIKTCGEIVQELMADFIQHPQPMNISL